MINENFQKTSSPFRHLVCGTQKKAPLEGGDLKTYINFDNAASTPPLKPVLEKINEFAPWYSSVHRGQGYKSQLSTNLYEKVRDIVAEFVNTSREKNTVIFTTNTTAAINKLAYKMQNREQIENEKKVKKRIIITSRMEHHSNLLPWRDKFELHYIPLTANKKISLSGLEQLLIKYQGQVKLLTVTGASNVTGTITPVYKMARLAHKYGTKIHIDGAQLIPHQPFDMKPFNSYEHIDYLSFSAHKLYAPFGSGVLIGPQRTFAQNKPDYQGGGTVELVSDQKTVWKNPPAREEAGTPNIIGAIALGQALKTLKNNNLKNISRYEKEISDYLTYKLKKIPEIIIYSLPDKNHKLSIIPFNIKKLSHKKTASLLAKKGIAVRSGCFCAQPYVQKLLNISPRQVKKRIDNLNQDHPGMVRVSLGMYNTRKEIDYFLKSIKEIIGKNIPED
ncbi:MAG: aminotransferase class V-fold PLP-dependent enzyme [Bacillota bacterium]